MSLCIVRYFIVLYFIITNNFTSINSLKIRPAAAAAASIRQSIDIVQSPDINQTVDILNSNWKLSCQRESGKASIVKVSLKSLLINNQLKLN